MWDSVAPGKRDANGGIFARLAMFGRERPRAVAMGLVAAVGLTLLVVWSAQAEAAAAVTAEERQRERYALQQFYWKYEPENGSKARKFNVAIVADMDTDSKVEDKMQWKSQVLVGQLTRMSDGTFKYATVKTVQLKTKLNEGGRGMELSELLNFGGDLFAFDDRSGVVSALDLERGMAIPKHILMEGNGHTEKGQKNEWATVKDGKMYVGSIGKEWTNAAGEVVNTNNLWIKSIDEAGHVEHIDWNPVFNLLRQKTGTSYPGYLIHEAVCFNNDLRRWFFFPRRESTLAYDDALDEERGSNLVISVSEDLKNVTKMRLGPVNPQRGFSSCKFLPYEEDVVVALKSMEVKGQINSYITVLKLDGTVLMPETDLGPVKYEGVEFI